MTASRTQPTLLVFTLGAEAESRRHRLVPESFRSAEVELRRECLERTLEAGRLAGFRLEISSPLDLDHLGAPARGLRHLPQKGRSFGARLDRALAASLRDHPGPVVVVGTDVPELSSRHLERALDALGDDPDRVVIGPSEDGGFYLLATRRPIEGLASAVSWCCAATLRTLLDTLAAAGRPVVLLEALADLDRPADLERWLAGHGPGDEDWHIVLRAIRHLLARRRRPPLTQRVARRCQGFFPAIPARGPPPHALTA